MNHFFKYLLSTYSSLGSVLTTGNTVKKTKKKKKEEILELTF